MNRLNDAPILDQTTNEQRETLMLIGLWKLAGTEVIKITTDDIKAFNAAFKSNPVLMIHGHIDSIDLAVVTLERAKVLAAHDDENTSKASH